MNFFAITLILFSCACYGDFLQQNKNLIKNYVFTFSSILIFNFIRTLIKRPHFRFAMRRKLNLVTFDNIFPFPDPSFFRHLLDSHPSLHNLSHFDIAADHMIYNREEFQQVMPNDTVYVSSLREPVAQFKSAVNYYWSVSHKERVEYIVADPEIFKRRRGETSVNLPLR